MGGYLVMVYSLHDIVGLTFDMAFLSRAMGMMMTFGLM
jgi:hypothetical protein